MGMDVYGKNPTCEAGEYFRANVWSWRPIAALTLELAPEECDPCEHWGTNDGDGLNADQSVQLAEKLSRSLASGEIGRIIVKARGDIHQMPDEECNICEGTGSRAEPPNPGPGPVSCNGCNGTGKKRPWEAHYDCSVEHFTEWLTFLHNCGGFELW